MHLYDSAVNQFIPNATSGRIAETLTRNFVAHMEYRPSDSEITSWRNSLGAFAEAINTRQMDDAWIILEYGLPLSSARLDCMLLGADATRRSNAVVVELKQWTDCIAHYIPDVVRIGGREHLHPSAQAQAYKHYLRDAHEAFADTAVGLHSCAYLHNVKSLDYTDFSVRQYQPLLADTPAFAADTVDQLATFISTKTSHGLDSAVLEEILGGNFRPSKTLLANVAASIDEYEPWQLLDQQLVIFNEIMAEIEQAHRTGKKKTIIVTGGPGTGKSIIAIQALGAAARRGYTTAHATGSKAFTTNLRGLIGRGAGKVFTYSSEYRKLPKDQLDLVIVDEAHRLRERTTNFWGKVIDERPQWERITNAARVAVYFLDEFQNVRAGEDGSVANIVEYSRAKHIDVSIHELDIQFRCAGSDSYVRWIDHALGLSPQNSTAWRTFDEYEVVVHDDVADLETAIRARATDGHTARLVAGFCWKWSKPRADNSLVPDVTIGDWSMPWNRKPEGSPTPARHPYTIWATQPEGVEEVGCIYSAQGFEFDYVGVIWADDLRWDPETGRWLADLSVNKDSSSFKEGITDDPEAAVERLAHVYRVLATRGMKGTHFYFTDPATRDHFKTLLAAAGT